MDADKLVDRIVELECYLYDWASSYTGRYTYVDHTNWTETCLILFQKYKFNISKIKEDIKNGTILMHHFTNAKLAKYEDQLYKAHREKAEAFEKRHLMDI